MRPKAATNDYKSVVVVFQFLSLLLSLYTPYSVVFGVFTVCYYVCLYVTAEGLVNTLHSSYSSYYNYNYSVSNPGTIFQSRDFGWSRDFVIGKHQSWDPGI